MSKETQEKIVKGVTTICVCSMLLCGTLAICAWSLKLLFIVIFD